MSKPAKQTWSDSLVVNLSTHNGKKTPQLRKIDCRQLSVDSQYQRALRRKIIADIAAHYQPELFAPIHVSKRKDGQLVIFDGHNRFYFKANVLKHRSIRAYVWDDLTIADEARFFRIMNYGRSQNTPMENFKARLIEKEPTAIAIARIMNQRGIAPALGGSTATGTRLKCISLIERIYANHGESVLASILDCITVWPGDDKHRLAYSILAGLALLFSEHGDAVDKGRLCERLKRETPIRLVAKARHIRADRPLSSPQAMLAVMVAIYNKGLRNRKLGG